jgi:hypothetical protein
VEFGVERVAHIGPAHDPLWASARECGTDHRRESAISGGRRTPSDRIELCCWVMKASRPFTSEGIMNLSNVEPSDNDAASHNAARPVRSVRKLPIHPSQQGKLTDAEKVTLWQQRFFEAQASCEEFLMEQGGWEAIDGWIEANSSITARRFSLLEPAKENRADYNVTRLVNQLRCYDSDISSQYDEEANAYTVTNRDCGILRYRKVAALGRVRLTFKSPCEYCTKLNTKIIQKYVGDASVEVELRDGGCQWKVTLSSNGTENESEQKGGGQCTLRSSPRPSMAI